MSCHDSYLYDYDSWTTSFWHKLDIPKSVTQESAWKFPFKTSPFLVSSLILLHKKPGNTWTCKCQVQAKAYQYAGMAADIAWQSVSQVGLLWTWCRESCDHKLQWVMTAMKRWDVLICCWNLLIVFFSWEAWWGSWLCGALRVLLPQISFQQNSQFIPSRGA